jgi:hypothetical protein
MCLRRAPEKYIAGAALDMAGLKDRDQMKSSHWSSWLSAGQGANDPIRGKMYCYISMGETDSNTVEAPAIKKLKCQHYCIYFSKQYGEGTKFRQSQPYRVK